MKLLLDQGLPRSAATFLRDNGFQADHVGDLGLSRASDLDLLNLARKEDACVVTLNADFHAILDLSHAPRPSVIRIRIEGLTGGAIGHLLLRMLDTARSEIEARAVVSVTPTRIRIRRLALLLD